jgi:hypothetical protein
VEPAKFYNFSLIMKEFHKVKPETVNFIKCASNVKQASIYRKLTIKYRIASLNIHFNSQCLSKGLTPSYVNIACKSKTSAAVHAMAAAKRTWIKRELHEWYVKRDSIAHYLYLLTIELTNSLHWTQWITLDDDVRQRASEIAFKKKASISKNLLPYRKSS